MANTTVQIDIELVTESFKSALTSATNQTKQFSQQAGKNFDIVKNSFAVMAGSLAANALGSFVSSISGAFSSVIAEASQAENSLNNLNIALRQAGLYSRENSNELQEFSDDLEKTSIYSGDAAQAALGLLATLTTLDKQGLKSATTAAADLAATLNVDLSTATEMITKAVNGNFTAFNKLGIEIQKGESDAERLTNVLKALEGQQGASTAAANTYSGALAKNENQKGKLLEAIGNIITQNPRVIEGINALSGAFASSAEWVSKNSDLLADIGKAFVVTTGIIGATAGALALASVGFSGLATAATAAWVAVTGPIGLAVAAIAGVGVAVFAVIRYWDDLRAATYNAGAAVLDYAAKAVGVLSEEKAQSLRNEAQAWRDKAQAINEASNAQTANNTTAADDAVATEQEQKRKARLLEEQTDIIRQNSFKAEQSRINNETLNVIEQERLIQEQELITQSEQVKLQSKEEFDALALESTYKAQESQLLARQEQERKLFELQVQSELAKANAEKDAQTRADALKATKDKAQIDRAKLLSKQELEVMKQQIKSEQDLQSKRAQYRSDTYATIATLAQSNNKELAAIGKAAGITQIAIDTPVAISKALAAFPPPFNFAAAALVGTAMAAQAANIAGVKFADGGIVPGSSNTGDRIRASLNSGEMVLNRNQQANLFKIANQGGSSSESNSSGTNQLLGKILEVLTQSTSIQIDGREIINVVRDGLTSGRSFA